MPLCRLLQPIAGETRLMPNGLRGCGKRRERISGERPIFLVCTDLDEFAAASSSNSRPVANREQQSEKNQGGEKEFRSLVGRFSKFSI